MKKNCLKTMLNRNKIMIIKQLKVVLEKVQQKFDLKKVKT